VFADIELAKRLERAEGFACLQFAAARKRIFPECDAEWMEYGGANVVFDGVDAPTTQTFGLGMVEPITEAVLDHVEQYFFSRGSDVFHEVCPLAGVDAVALLCSRGYQPVEISNVMYQVLTALAPLQNDSIRIRVTGSEDAELWADVNARAWGQEHPEFMDFFRTLGKTAHAREESYCFLGEVDGTPAAAGSLSIHGGVALCGGAATVPEYRRRGLQGALLRERLRFAFGRGCDLAMMVAMAGSDSQRNAERKGFRVAYTRTKWRLPRLSAS
jgi:GNAT superfamily N-acetyltransferase